MCSFRIQLQEKRMLMNYFKSSLKMYLLINNCIIQNSESNQAKLRNAVLTCYHDSLQTDILLQNFLPQVVERVILV